MSDYRPQFALYSFVKVDKRREPVGVAYHVVSTSRESAREELWDSYMECTNGTYPKDDMEEIQAHTSQFVLEIRGIGETLVTNTPL